MELRACLLIKGGISECFRIDSVRHGSIMSPWLFNVYMDVVMKVKMGMGRREEIRDCLASCMQMSWFSMVSWRKT